MSLVQKAQQVLKDLGDKLVGKEKTDLPVLRDPPASKDLPANKASKAPKGRKGK